jgi:hypothetical protein
VSRRHPKRRMTGKHFAAIPVEVLTCDACRTLPNYAIRVLLAIAAQYRGNNNGDLALTWSLALPFGVTCKAHLVKALTMLQERGLIAKTRQGGKRPMGPCLYALTWQPINDLNGKIDSGPTTAASNDWVKWTASSGLPVDQSTENQRDYPQTSTGLPVDQRSAVTGLPADQRTPSIGTTSSPPSRISPEGAAGTDTAGAVVVLVPTSDSKARKPGRSNGKLHEARTPREVS